MNTWAIGALDGPARVFIKSTRAEELLAQLQPGEVMSPIPESVAQSGDTVILRADLQFNIVEPTDG